MHTKTGIVFGIVTIAAAVLLFAAGPVVAFHQAWACGFGGWRPHFYGGYPAYSGGSGGYPAYSGGSGGYPAYSGGYPSGSNNGFSGGSGGSGLGG
jgi:hypothetical protein